MKVPFVSFKVLEHQLNSELRGAFERVFERSWYIDGKEDEAFGYRDQGSEKTVSPGAGAYQCGAGKTVLHGGTPGDGYAQLHRS